MDDYMGSVFDAKTGEKVGDVPKAVNLSFDGLHVTEAENARGKVREVRFEWFESRGAYSRSLTPDTFLTWREIRKLVRDAMRE